MQLFHAFSIFVLAHLVGQVASECCGSGGNCTGVGPCNIFCCNCDARLCRDLVTHDCRVFVCVDAWTGEYCTDSDVVLARSALDVAEEDARMLHEASGGTGLMSREAFVSYSATLGSHDRDMLHARFEE
ncbi:hypothetical protein QBC34DRAFT_462536 [Podospora aff. communis PSN243]|uniref:Uncharacterized protein n=1 Tax=Podospora aff. communis PSN243 TaxID=3040156 RepID=A0AAV9GRA2_9PEZI|nr:hypothetical protein QBC34DRAFT_462536 [Podospora aff. communis PSN243]